jgi:hypothetical protein
MRGLTDPEAFVSILDVQDLRDYKVRGHAIRLFSLERNRLIRVRMRFVAIGFRGHIGVEDVCLFLHGPQVRPHLPISIRIVLGGIPPPQRGFRNSLGVCCDVGEHPFGESRFCHSTEQARKTLFTIWVRALSIQNWLGFGRR